MEIIPFMAEHLDGFELQPMQSISQSYCTEEMGKALQQCDSWSAVVDGRVIACAGIVEQWEGRAIAWAFLSTHAKGHMHGIHKAVSRFLELCNCERIEAHADCEFKEAGRWLNMLGFKCEGKMPKFRFGRDYYLYGKVR